jgi:hypothetical protein
MNNVKETINEENTGGAAIAAEELEGLKLQAGEFEPVNEDEPESAGPVISTAKQLEPLIGLSFKVLAPNWNVQPEEVEVLAESYGDAIDFYFPEMNGGLPPWATPLIVTAAIIGPRVSIPRIKEEKTVNGGDDASTES